MLHIAEINCKLETLELHTLDDELEHSLFICFPNLKELILSGNWQENLHSFIRRHSNTLEKVVIKWAYDFTEPIINSFLKCKHLKYLDLRLKNPSNKEIFNELSLKILPFILVITKSNFKSVYNFPEDKAIWDEKKAFIESSLCSHEEAAQ